MFQSSEANLLSSQGTECLLTFQVDIDNQQDACVWRLGPEIGFRARALVRKESLNVYWGGQTEEGKRRKRERKAEK